MITDSEINLGGGVVNTFLLANTLFYAYGYIAIQNF